MDRDEQLTARLEAARHECEAWRPLFFRTANQEDRHALAALLEERPDTEVFDTIIEQLVDLLRTRNPAERMSENAARELVPGHLGRVRLEDYGVWVYYPWSRRLVHLLDEAEFVELRTNRNKYKLTPEEQERLAMKKVGIVGLSVGQTVATTLALERSVGEIRLADFDRLDVSNLNRIRTGIHNLGISKVLIAAREIAELDPFLKIVLYPVGIHDENITAFILRGGKLDVLIDECDSIDIKLKLRLAARLHRIPVVMETSDRSLIDVERFDREPARPIFHGLVGNIDPEQLANLSTEEKIPYVLKIIGADTMSPRMVSSMIEIESSIKTWPQLGSCVVYGGGACADIVRRINLGHMTYSGRFVADIESSVPDDDAREPEPEGGTLLPEPAEPVAPRVHHDSLTNEQMISAARALARPAGHLPWQPELARELVTVASLAPSGGNMQPWRWLLRDGRLHLFHERSRSEGLTDFRHLAAFASLGAALESARLAAHARGAELSISTFPAGAATELVAVVDRLAAPAPGAEPRWREDLAGQLGQRHTNRRGSQRQPLEPAVCDALREAASSIEGATLSFVSDEDELAQIGELLGAADRLRMLHVGLHREMYQEVRWTAEEADATRDGLLVDTLELSPADRAGLLMCRRHEALAFLDSFGGGRGLGKMAMKAIASASAVGLLTVPRPTPGDFLRGGRALQRLWLVAQERRLALCPMTVLLYMFMRLFHGDGEGLTPSTITELRALWPRFSRLFPVPREHGLVMLFRLSRAEAPTLRSLRRPLDEILHVART